MRSLAKLLTSFLVAAGVIAVGNGEEIKTIVIVILSQRGQPHPSLALLEKHALKKQAADVSRDLVVEVLCLHDEWKDTTGAWTVIPIIPDIYDQFSSADWTIFIGERTNVSLKVLYSLLLEYNQKEELFLGRALTDDRPAIIHHFAFAEDPNSFAYPDFQSGFILSNALMTRLADNSHRVRLQTDFSIDAQHELAMFIWDSGRGVRLTHVHQLCASSDGSRSDGRGHNVSAATCASTYDARIPDCDVEDLTEDDIFVMVKTCKKFHYERLPVIKKLWGDKTKHIEYCSEEADVNVSTIALGVKNTERGHCSKLLAILRRAATEPHISRRKWLVIADDDTLLNMRRLTKLLKCYSSSVATALGERYGYSVRGGRRSGGYDYITGGGGMVLSLTAVKQLLQQKVYCQADDTADDMMLGIWLLRLGIPVTHSALFHQAQPEEYSKDYLKHQESISFHKFSGEADASAVFKRWLADSSVERMHVRGLQLPHTEL